MLGRSHGVSSLQITRDRKLARQLLRGDQRAFTAFVDEYLPKLYRYANCQLHNSQDAEDVVQIALTNAARRLETYRGEATLLTWLIQICRHEIYRMQRKARRRDMSLPFLNDDLLKAVIESVESPPAQNPDMVYARSELIAFIQLALDQIPETYARLLELKYVEGLSSREIADEMGTSDEATQSMLARARRAFREVCNQAVPNLAPNADAGK